MWHTPIGPRQLSRRLRSLCFLNSPVQIFGPSIKTNLFDLFFESFIPLFTSFFSLSLFEPPLFFNFATVKLAVLAVLYFHFPPLNLVSNINLFSLYTVLFSIHSILFMCLLQNTFLFFLAFSGKNLARTTCISLSNL